MAKPLILIPDSTPFAAAKTTSLPLILLTTHAFALLYFTITFQEELDYVFV